MKRFIAWLTTMLFTHVNDFIAHRSFSGKMQWKKEGSWQILKGK